MVPYGLSIEKKSIGILNLRKTEIYIGDIHSSITFLRYSVWNLISLNQLYLDGFVSKTEYDKVDDEYIRDYIGNISDVPNYREIEEKKDDTIKGVYLRLINTSIENSKNYINTVSQDKQGEFYELLNHQIKKLNSMGYQLGNYGEENFNKDNLGN